jgi:hypothetical protein
VDDDVIAWIAEADRRSSGKTPTNTGSAINSPKGRFGCRMRHAAEVAPNRAIYKSTGYPQTR